MTRNAASPANNAFMGMDSKKLSAREKQPGHDRTFEVSEANFYEALCEILPDTKSFSVVDHPRDLLDIFGGHYGVRPEASIEYLPTGNKMYFEVKKQGDRGNAEERACKHHTVQFYKTLAARTGFSYHAYSTVMCESLATNPRYTTKSPYYFEADHYLEWVDYEFDLLSSYVDMVIEKYLKPETVSRQMVPA